MAVERFELLELLAEHVPDDALVMATYIGAVSFEWGCITEEHPRSAHLGQMGDVIGLAVGLALALPHRRVICLDGDGSVLMELGQLIVLGQERPPNLTTVVVDNRCYESIGWSAHGRRPTATAGRADLTALATAAGVPYARTVESMGELNRELTAAFDEGGCRFLDVKTNPGASRVPPRQTDGIEDKYRFVRYVERLEGKPVVLFAQQVRQLQHESSLR